MDGTEDHHVKYKKPDWERQIEHVCSHMLNWGMGEGYESKRGRLLGMWKGKREEDKKE
jgi:hypothetical protein